MKIKIDLPTLKAWKSAGLSIVIIKQTHKYVYIRVGGIR